MDKVQKPVIPKFERHGQLKGRVRKEDWKKWRQIERKNN
jgi:hypothetical protein